MINRNNDLELAKIAKSIFQVFIKNKSKLWNIDTNWYKTWERFFNNLSGLRNEWNSGNINLSNAKIVCTGRDRFQFLINGEQLEPNSKREKHPSISWAGGSMRQFLDQGVAFGFWINISKNKISEKLHINSIIKYTLTSNFYEILKNNFWNNFSHLILITMQKALISYSQPTKNLGFSIFATLLYKEKIILPDANNLYITKKRVRNGLSKTLKYNTEEYNKYIEKINKETYNDIVEKLISEFKIENILNMLNKFIENKKIEVILSKHELETLEFETKMNYFINIIDNGRINLRSKILNDRKISSENDYYNDLENTVPEKWCVRDCEACHIYEVSNIKTDVIEMINQGSTDKEIQNFIEEVIDNPKNGILMLTHWHHYFDKQLFYFNTEGKIVFENDKNIIKRLKSIYLNSDSDSLKNVKIKDNILDKKMKEFLNHRLINQKHLSK